MTFFLVTANFSQKNDFIWMLGEDSIPSNPFNNYRDPFSIDFNFRNPKISTYKKSDFGFFFNTGSFSSDNGELLLFTNGTNIFNNNYEIMENGDSINPGWFQDFSFRNYRNGGYATNNGSSAIYNPQNKNEILLFHCGVELIGSDKNEVWSNSPLYYSIIDISANSGMGKVVKKNSILLEGTLGEFDLTKHGNGKDWWLVIPDVLSNKIDIFLISDKGISLNSTVYQGPKRENRGHSFGHNQFSPNGEIFVKQDTYAGIDIFSFDRCDGLLEYNQTINYTEETQLLGIDQGLAFSPNSKYLYANDMIELRQYDLQTANINLSANYISLYDNQVSTLPTLFATMQLAPNDKIYMTARHENDRFHIIERPNLRGLSCLVNQNELIIPVFNFNAVPDFPNYRLDSLNCGSGIKLDQVEFVRNSTTTEYEKTPWNMDNPEHYHYIDSLFKTQHPIGRSLNN